ncbi:biotin-dependent carboxyltransferase family protein [Acetohalobium arabaticum]|uniref:Urea amidolyase related protein n=1 Tax=Acetohalobium arabaticum (strain ATCC 49924 / DSM 5501 / Z-7288) TaxID=574087 RepID=D9QUX9_ACEAZ|nr:biotin-dependent carboxyltransferase family protein [Acetohalobium arabaticum]ADL12038.1 urea amidolyase related protein [Acetohalobium arabaticum DSM 5501]
MGEIKIIKSGMLTLIEDDGRYGYQQYGVPVSGTMDFFAHRLANILVGNDELESVLETTIIGPEIEFHDDMVIAITGADSSPILNGKSIPLWQSIRVHRGDHLSFNGIKDGCRSYIAFSGGFDVPVVMDSKSTYIKAGIGGFKGRALNQGDVLRIGEPTEEITELEGRKIPQEYINYHLQDNINIRVVLGPQKEYFTAKGIEAFLSNKYEITNESDRMGYRLNGEEIEHKKSADILSDGIAMGAVQVPSNGQPIIMMADRQVTGGYTKIANVITVDLPKIAQAKPGQEIEFEAITVQKAQKLLRSFENKINFIKRVFKLKLKNNKKLITYRLDELSKLFLDNIKDEVKDCTDKREEINLSKIKELVKLLNETDVYEINFKKNDIKINIKKRSARNF